MKKNKYWIYVIVIVILILLLFSIVYLKLNPSNVENFIQNISTESDVSQTSTETVEIEYTDKDLDESWDDVSATKVNLNDDVSTVDGSGASVSGSVITINSAGEYYFTGNLSNGSIIVEAGESDDVQIILDNVDIYCSNSAPIYIKQADKVVITLADDSDNKLSDGTEFELNENEEPNSTIFSKTNLTINGNGKLTIDANYEDAIASKDNLKIVNGTININAIDDGIRGKDCVAIKSGIINIVSGGDAIKSTNEDEKGYVVIDGGDISISAGDDGIHGERVLIINNGTINITKSYEGIESPDLQINGGNITIKSSDDGINAAGGAITTTESSQNTQTNGRMGGGMESTSSGTLTINGGYIYVDADGDGIDVNGSAVMNDGEVIVFGPTNNGNGALDYDGTFTINGGKLILAGSSGMLQTPSNSSSQNSISKTFTSVQSANTTVTIKDSDGNEIVSFSPTKQYQSVVVSLPEIESNKTYSFSIK